MSPYLAFNYINYESTDDGKVKYFTYPTPADKYDYLSCYVAQHAVESVMVIYDENLVEIHLIDGKLYSIDFPDSKTLREWHHRYFKEMD